MELNSIEESIIRNMMLSKSNKVIAALLDIPVKDVAAFVDRISEETGLIPKNEKLTLVSYKAKPPRHEDEPVQNWQRPPAVYSNPDWTKAYLD